MTEAAMKSVWIIEEFAYRQGPEAPDGMGSRWAFEEEDAAEEDTPETQHSSASTGSAVSAEDELLLEAERRGFAAGREQGREEGRAEQRDHEREANTTLAHTVEARRKEERARLMESLDAACQQYIHDIEPEVVRLALAVAARILRREAQMDPLLLSGAVRVALGQLASSTRVKLRVPQGDLELWREAIALVPNPGSRPEVTAGEGMRLGDCIIETELGSVDLGVRAQLSEIERGFFDRPGSHAAAHAARHNSRQNSAEETA
ncbi:FliH/SctL family protein [Terracidiphilus gabretensis]|uniref:FliH/SctL family protein n=1 Tax=Terracidiphilus gabretensis TaxID=1577687 RepID=UPI00071B3A67|nr:FliH/SctL family protein [Terracidiphilus gabretensis]